MIRRRTVLMGFLGAAGVAGALALLESGGGRGVTDGTPSDDGPWARVTLRVDGMS